jgi:hypothetical protein
MATQDADLYVSPEGDDDWSGERAEPAGDGTDGPFRTIERAQRAVRERTADAGIDGELTVSLRGGTYRREEPLTFGPADSAPVTYAAYPDAHYYVENVFEALSAPGEWYLDHETGELWYVPREGESIGEVEVVAPRLTTLVSVEGDPDAGAFVEFLGFERLTFAHSTWEYAPPGYIQAASEQPGAITAIGGHNLAFEDCTVRHVGMHGLELGPGCRSVRVAGCEFVDLGAGGVKIDGGTVDESRERRTGRVRVVDTHLHRGGRVFHRGVGLLAMHAFDVDLSHNHVHDFYYSGVSCGWSWGYDEQVARDNRIA